MQVKIGIIGLGAIGSLIAKSILLSSDHNLFYFSRKPKTEIKIEHKGHSFIQPIVCSNVETFNTKLDWLIICLKAHHFEGAHHIFNTLIKKDTKIAIIRNGIHLSEDLLPYTTIDHTLPCMIDCPVQPKPNGSYWQLKNPSLTLPNTKLAKKFESMFSNTSCEIHITDDFKTASWKKLIESASLGVLQCIARDTCRIFKDPKVLAQYGDLIDEGVRVALADGAKIEAGFREHLLQKVTTYPDDKGSSMLTDLLAGRPLELDAKNGAILKVAVSHHYDMPLNQKYYSILNELNV